MVQLMFNDNFNLFKSLIKIKVLKSVKIKNLNINFGFEN